MTETITQFYGRIYVNFVRDIVFVYPHKIGLGKPDKWTTQQAKQYLNHLNSQIELEV